MSYAGAVVSARSASAVQIAPTTSTVPNSSSVGLAKPKATKHGEENDDDAARADGQLEAAAEFGARALDVVVAKQEREHSGDSDPRLIRRRHAEERERDVRSDDESQSQRDEVDAERKDGSCGFGHRPSNKLKHRRP